MVEKIANIEDFLVETLSVSKEIAVLNADAIERVISADTLCSIYRFNGKQKYGENAKKCVGFLMIQHKYRRSKNKRLTKTTE